MTTMGSKIGRMANPGREHAMRWPSHRAACIGNPALCRQPVMSMPIRLPGSRAVIAAIAAWLACSSAASAQALAKPAVTPTRPVAAPASRAASCHNGLSFDRFLADLKQQAVAAGVSPRTIEEASPHLVYDPGIVRRDHGQRVFGQIFTEFAARMAAPYRMQQGQARIKTYAAAFARAEKEYGVPPAVISRVLGSGERLRRQHGQSADAALAGFAGL